MGTHQAVHIGDRNLGQVLCRIPPQEVWAAIADPMDPRITCPACKRAHAVNLQNAAITISNLTQKKIEEPQQPMPGWFNFQIMEDLKKPQYEENGAFQDLSKLLERADNKHLLPPTALDHLVQKERKIKETKEARHFKAKMLVLGVITLILLGSVALLIGGLR